jgi:CHAD domain-containing protein
MADRSFGGYAKRVIKRALKHLLRDGHSAVDAGDEDALHALRIDVKRLRYTIEFAAPLLAERGREPLALLALAQERLGALADADMFARTFGAMLGALATDDERVPGLQRLCDDAQRRREAALEGVRALWQGEGGAPMSGQRSYPDKLAGSISATLGSLSKDDGS